MSWKRIKANVMPDPSDPSLVWAPSLKSVEEIMVDRSNSFLDSTITPPCHEADGILDDTYTFDGGHVYRSTSGTVLNGVDPSFTVSCWIKVPSSPVAPEYICNTTTTFFSLILTAADIRSRGYSDAGVVDATWAQLLNDTRWHHLVGVHDRDVGQYLYVDGVQKAFTAGAVQTFAVVAQSMYLASRSGVDHFYGDMTAPAYYDEAKSAAWVKAEFEKSRYAIHYKQGADITLGSYTVGDWVDGLPGYISQGTMAVETETIDGDPAIVGRSASNYFLEFYPDGYYNGCMGNTDSESLYGEWEFWFKNSTATSNFYFGNHALNSMQLQILGTHSLASASMLVQGLTSAFGSAAGAIPGEWLRLKVRLEKDLAQGWRASLFRNGQLIAASTGANPTTWRNFTPTFNNIRFNVGSTCKIRLDGLTKRMGWEVGP